MTKYKGAFINGHFVRPREKNDRKIVDPGNIDLLVGEWSDTLECVDPAVDAARRAFTTWARTDQATRCQYLHNLQRVYEAHVSDLAEQISREMGKTLREALAEVQSAIQKIEITIKEAIKLIAEVRSDKNGSYYRFHPRGVLAIIGPFNFPLQLPNAQVAAALASGNTVVLKPSELTPFTGQLMARCIQEAGFPPGTFNLVQGDRVVGEALASHPDVDGVIFIGSEKTGKKIRRRTMKDSNKICVLEMGGKNAAVIMDDAPFDKCVDECASSALMTTGQRCNALSRIIVHEDLVTQFTVEFSCRVLEWVPGYYEDTAAKMGPLVSQAAVKKFLKYQEKARKEGARQVLQGCPISKHPRGHYVLPAIHRVEWNGPQADRIGYSYDEIFAPDVAIYTFKTVEEAIQIHNDCRYGLVASVFTKKKTVFEEMYHNLKVGNLHWNKGTIGTSPHLPFGGIKSSGNNFPSGLFSPYYCTYPVSVQM